MRLIERDVIGSDSRKITRLSSIDRGVVVAEAVRTEQALLKHLVQFFEVFISRFHFFAALLFFCLWIEK
jgi:hypothetical protein